MGVEITIEGIDEAIRSALQPRIEAALSVADEVPQIIKDQSVLENEAVDGSQFAKKQPRPKKNPTNNPNAALIDSGNLLDWDRFKTEAVSPTERDCVYTPPDYHKYLIEKDPDHGGRKWLTQTEINDTAAKLIEQKMVEAFEGGSK